MSSKRTIVLDAMGVIYRARDDVEELLVPFIRSHGSSIDTGELNILYEKASLGQLDVDEFWRELDLSPAIEDEYLAGHELNEGALDFLNFARNIGIDVWCLSNDVSRWSFKLRKRFLLEDLFVDFVISADIGFRKPSEQAYHCLIDRIGHLPDLFVDDRVRNVSAAQLAGIPSVCFGASSGEYNRVWDFDSLQNRVQSIGTF
ncbi:MAG: HAD-IA family hydrolase [Gammaproteobacteria bacterium]|nr:HAD-IA family hydrolase [Gammaproteobacteria bacterium]